VESEKGLESLPSRHCLSRRLEDLQIAGSPSRLMETPLLLDVTSNVFSLSGLPENC